jgi:RNA polymerase sigma factor (sigma-70 family)
VHGAMAVSETAPVETFGLERAFSEHQGRVFRAAYRITGNVHDAEDVLQTVFLRLAGQGEGFAALHNPRELLLPGGHQRRSRRAARPARAAGPAHRRQPPPRTGGGESPWTPEQVHDAAELRAWLRHAVAPLDPRPAEVFALRYLEGQGNRDIAHGGPVRKEFEASLRCSSEPPYLGPAERTAPSVPIDEQAFNHARMRLVRIRTPA